MANEPDLNTDAPVEGGSDARSVARWMNTSRYVALTSLLAARDLGGAEKDRAPLAPLRRRLTNEDRDALLYAGVILLVIAVAAFVAGLL